MPADADFYALELLLDDQDRALLQRVRGFMEKEVQPIYTPLDAAETSAEALGMPGFYPYTRGIHPTGYRGTA